MATTPAWIEREKAALGELLGKFDEDSEDLRKFAAEALSLSADIAVAELRGEDTEVAQKAMRSIVLNLKAIGSARVAYTVVGHIEDVLGRIVGMGTRVLLRGLV